MISDVLFAAYRYVGSPFLHALAGLLGVPAPGCRFQPSCGEFARHVIREQGWRRGGGKALARLARCHPWGGESK